MATISPAPGEDGERHAGAERRHAEIVNLGRLVAVTAVFTGL